MNKTNNILTLAGALALTLGATGAQAAFVYQDSFTPVGSPSVAVPSINDFQSQLAGVGVSSFYLGRSLAVSNAHAGDSINIDFFAAEAGYRNQLWWGTSLILDNQGNRSWSERDLGNFATGNGVQNFAFCSQTISACFSNLANDGSAIGSFQSIGLRITDGGNTAWLLWDDSGANMDDNHDDLIVRLTYRSVPEPGTLALMGLGLAGAALARRRKAANA